VSVFFLLLPVGRRPRHEVVIFLLLVFAPWIALAAGALRPSTRIIEDRHSNRDRGMTDSYLQRERSGQNMNEGIKALCFRYPPCLALLSLRDRASGANAAQVHLHLVLIFGHATLVCRANQRPVRSGASWNCKQSLKAAHHLLTTSAATRRGQRRVELVPTCTALPVSRQAAQLLEHAAQGQSLKDAEPRHPPRLNPAGPVLVSELRTKGGLDSKSGGY